MIHVRPDNAVVTYGKLADLRRLDRRYTVPTDPANIHGGLQPPVENAAPRKALAARPLPIERSETRRRTGAP